MAKIWGVQVCVYTRKWEKTSKVVGGGAFITFAVGFKTRPFLAAAYSPKIASIERKLALETLIK